MAAVASRSGQWNPVEVFERFTDRARRVLVFAQEEARLLNHSFLGTEHILLGLIHEGDGVAAQALAQLGISLESVRNKVEETISVSGTPPTGSPPFTPRAKKVLELSLREALQLGHNYIGTEHLLLGLVREGEGVAAQVLVSLGADLARTRQLVIHLLSGYHGQESVGAGPSSTPSETPPGSTVLRAGQHGALVQCSFCGRRPPESGRLISGRGDAFVCEHCVREWADRLDGDAEDRRSDEEVGEASVAYAAHFYEDKVAQRESASAMDMGLADDPDDTTRIMVRITGVPDQPGTVAHLFRILATNSVDVNKIASEVSDAGTLEIAFTVSKATQSAFLFAYGEFQDEMLGPGG
jgi:predicted amino acid-binding ACT domain protein